MTLRERAIAALEYRIPDAVPTFELEFQLTPELMGTDGISSPASSLTDYPRWNVRKNCTRTPG